MTEPVEPTVPVDEEMKTSDQESVPETRDPGNTDPAEITEPLTDEETFVANKAVEEAIASLPVSNEGVL